jgi:outer membrane protein assembly factor BamB
MAYESTLAAFDRQDGTIAWQATLSDEVSNSCQGCLQVLGNAVVALTTDGVLSGIDAQTGQPTWSVRLNATPRQLLNLGGNVGVLDEEADDVGISVYETATGGLVGRIVPECPNDVFPDHPQTLGIYDQVLVSADGSNLYVPIADRDPGCIQSWDAATLAQVWQTSVPREIVNTMEREPYLLTDRSLYAGGSHSLFAVNLIDHTHREVFSDEDHNLIPLAARDGILVALAERTRGTRKHSVRAIDSVTGSKLWQFEPEAEELDDGGKGVAHSSGIWSLGVTSDRVIILEAFSDPSYLLFTDLKLADGSTSGSRKLDLGDDGFSFWFQVLGWRRDRVYLVMDNELRVVDFMTAEEIDAWP